MPRLVVGGVSSGVGKTTAVVGLAGALRARGLRVACFKCGPDYLDPTYHSRVAGTASHTLDGWMMGRDAVLSTVRLGAADADIALIEGVMGLFDGAGPTTESGSTAEIAKWLAAPVLLVADASGMARTISALGQGFAAFDPELRLAGLLANRVGGKPHLALLREACGEVPLLGGLPDQPDHVFAERHLGLRSARDAAAVSPALLSHWAGLVEAWCDLDALLALARSAPELPGGRTPLPEPPSTVRCRIGLAHDAAFQFYYPENLARLASLGAELVRFSPAIDAGLPAVDGLYFGGGYPETVAAQLSGNESMRVAVRALAEAGAPIYAECGGLMYLSEGIETLDGAYYPMVSLIGGRCRMLPRLAALGYAEVQTQAPSILGPPGLRFRGHQFRYSELVDQPEPAPRVYAVRSGPGGAARPEGYRLGENVLASYVHAHWASNPRVAAGFVDSCARYRESRQ